MKQLWYFFFFFTLTIFAQQEQKYVVSKQVIPAKDTIVLEKISIQPFNFKLTDSLHQKIDSTKYKVLFKKGIIILKDSTLKHHRINIQYKKFPDFLTKTYRALDTNVIVKDIQNGFRRYHSTPIKNNVGNPFLSGLETKGTISRGITFGNNQDGVLDSNLELRIQGNLSDKVKIRANIIDSNIPVQNNGYTQRLDEFDKIFMEFYTKKWRVIAGDLPFSYQKLKYLQFQKKVQGLSVQSTLGDSIKNTNFYVSGAVVRGKFTSNSFQGQNGNQGPYNIIQQENAYWLIVANSETVYVNGIKIEKNKDYTIDYNTAEIYFNPTFPINATMRIYVEFQISDQNYTRYVSFDEVHYKNVNSAVQVSFYNENDAKNSALNQNLTQEQLAILANAGDDESQMVVPSAIPEEYDENKIQYKKEIQNSTEIYVFSNNPNDELYHVNFTFVGQNNGNYKIDEVLAIGKVFGYIAPIGSQKQGSYEPIIKLVAPNKLQLVNLQSSFAFNKKTTIKSEFSYSYFDKNLFSNKQDNDNSGFAGNLAVNQKILDKKWQAYASVYNEFISKNFKTIERLQDVEFNRNWNLNQQIKTPQNLFKFRFSVLKDSLFKMDYTFNQLDLKNHFKGNKHQINLVHQSKKLQWKSALSLLKTNALLENSSYNTTNNSVKYLFKNKWIGSDFTLENNQRTDKITNALNALSFKNQFLKTYVGIGNSQKIFTEFGYTFRKSDSVENNQFSVFEKANGLYLDAQFINNKKAHLTIYSNYEVSKTRLLNTTKFLNTQLKYKQQLWNNILNFTVEYQTGSGNLPQQDYQYIEVEPGHGYYQWIDYNNDGIKDLDEFEVANFSDQAKYLKIALPTINYIKVNQNKINSSLLLNFASISKKKKGYKILSHFSNQTSITTDVKRNRNQEFIHLNPFDYKQESVLALLANFKNSLYFNRGKQHYSTTLSYLETNNKSVFITGFQKNKIQQYRLKFEHLLHQQWLFKTEGIQGENESNFETFTQRNFAISKKQILFNLNFLQSKTLQFGAEYQYKNGFNKIGAQEKLLASTYGVKINYTKDENTSFQANFKYIDNQFNGNSLSAVGYQLLEGLQNGKNYTWQVSIHKKINSFLHLNLNYQARKSAISNTIHVGSVQLRAVF